LGSDGLYRFTDSTGAVQVLRPAFLDTDGLSAQFGLAMGGTSTIQLDGTSLFTLISGQTLVLTPDYFLSPVPSANAAKLFWQDASNHYQFRSNIITLSQGTTAK
jgi:hypothetical protein